MYLFPPTKIVFEECNVKGEKILLHITSKKKRAKENYTHSLFFF